MAYSGAHNPRNVRRFSDERTSRPDPPGSPSWSGGPEDFETLWTLKGHKLPPAGSVDPDEAAKISRNHNRLYETPGFDY